MTSGEREWNIEVVQKRFQGQYKVELTNEQAELIFKQEQFSGSVAHYFSVWENMDYELSYLGRILNDHQLRTFREVSELGIKRFEEELIKQDNDDLTANQLAAANRTLEHYKEVLLPRLFGDYTLSLGIFQEERPKIDYLKAEYKIYLERRKKEILLGHFRNSRRFQPNMLKLSLFIYEQNCLFPDYYNFKVNMGEPAIVVKDFLMKRLTHYIQQTDEKLNKIFGEIKEFMVENVKKNVEEIPGWHASVSYSEAEEREYRMMCIVLLDRKKYVDLM